MRTVKFATLVIAASATLFACKPKEEAPVPVAEVAEEESPAEKAAAVDAAERREACNINMSVPENADWTTYWEPSGASGNGAKSVHWANDTEKEAQASNFLAVPLEITCSTSESPNLTVTLSASNSSTSDVPMAPGSYPIWGRQQPPVKGGQFLTATLTYDGRVFDSRSGTISISEFTSDRVSGTFTLEGAEMNTEEAAPIRIQGSFEFPCRGGLMESLCTASHD